MTYFGIRGGRVSNVKLGRVVFARYDPFFGRILGGFGAKQLSRRAALLAPRRRPQSRPYLIDTDTPCVLAWKRASHPSDEHFHAKPS